MAQMPSKKTKTLLNVIELYKDMPYLWDKKHKDYKNKDIRNNGNKKLLDVYKSLDSEATTKTLVKKIQNLRTNYFKELRKVKESLRSAAGADEVYVPTLWYFDAMSFLGTGSESSRSGWEAMEGEDASTSSTERESVRRYLSSSRSSQKSKRLTKASLLQNQESSMESAGPLWHMKEEDCEIIGKGIGLQLTHLNKKQFIIAQKMIHDTIYYAQMGLLTEDSSITGLLRTQPQVSRTKHLDTPRPQESLGEYTRSSSASSSPYFYNPDTKTSVKPSSPKSPRQITHLSDSNIIHTYSSPTSSRSSFPPKVMVSSPQQIPIQFSPRLQKYGVQGEDDSDTSSST